MKFDADELKHLFLELDKQVAELVEAQQLATEALTKELLTAAIVQAVKAGDFVKFVRLDYGGLNVVYIPYYECERLRAENEQLKNKLKELGYETFNQ